MKLKFTFFFLLVILTNQLLHAQGVCSQVYYLDQDSDGYGTTAIFSGETSQNYGWSQQIGFWGNPINFSTGLNNLVSFNYSITNTAATSQCLFQFYSGGNVVATVEAYPQNGGTINTTYNFAAPLFNITSVVVYSYWNPAYLNSLTFLAIPSSVTACSQPTGYAVSNTDCNDANATVNPGMLDICNAVDDDCDGAIDNQLYFADSDGDGYGVIPNILTEGNSVVVVNNNEIIIVGNDPNFGEYLQGKVSFVVPQDATYTFDWSYSTADESAEWDPAYYINNVPIPLTVDEVAGNQSGSISVTVTAGSIFGFSVVSVDGEEGSATLTITNFNALSNIIGGVTVCQAPVGYVINHSDCNDLLVSLNPGATEVCNSIDDDCDGQVDESVQNMYFEDNDGDGYGENPGAITQGNSVVVVNDNEIIIIGNDPYYGDHLQGNISFVVPQNATYTFDWGYSTVDESPEWDPSYYINNVSIPLSNDEGANSQSGSVSVAVTAGSTFGFSVVSVDGEAGSAKLTITNFNGMSNLIGGISACSPPGGGYVTNNDDCNDSKNIIHPGLSEVCNYYDDNCDGQVDEGLNTYYADNDGDGFGAGALSLTCEQENGFVLINGDCNDNSVAIKPSATEVCNGVDENCNGQVDDGFAPDITNVTSCGPYVWAENNTTYNSSGTYYINPPASTTYSSYASFVSASNSAGYQVSATEDFNEFWEYSAGASGSLGDGFPTWSAGANTGFYCIPVNGSVALAPNDFASPVTLYFSSGVTGVGGNFCITNVLGTLMNHTINFSLSDGTTQSMVIDSYDTFTGFLSSGALITSITINTPWISANNPYVRIDNLFVTTGTPPALPCSTKALQLVVNNLGTYYADADGDGFGTGTETVTCNPPLGSVSNNWDCNDTLSISFPGATEVCNGVDDNCDGQTDEGLNTFYADLDDDGYGAGSAAITCNPSSGFVVSNNDCNDNSAAINPAATEICNALDDNCDGQVDEGLLSSYYVDTDGDGYGFDAVTETLPGAWVLYTPSAFVLVGTPDYWIGVSNKIQFVAPTTETYTFNWAYAILDDPDQDPAYYFINDQIVVLSDEWGALYQSGSVTVTVNAGDVFGFGINSWDDEAGPVWLEITNFNARPYMGISVSCSQPTGYSVSNTDCDNANAAVNPGATEVCNTIDDNCDSEIDEGVQNTYYVDADLDGFGGNTTAMACAISAGYSAENSDCNESLAAVNPGASELCNGIDDNCNGQLDEGVQSTFYLDDDSDGFGTSEVFSGETNQNYGSGQYLGSWGHTMNFPTALNNLVSFNYSITNTAAMSQCVFRFYNGANQVASVEAYPQNGETISTGYNFSSPLFNITSVQVFSYWNPAYLNSLTFQSFPSSVVACTQPAGYASSNTDCNDSNASVNTGMNEICNTIDDDCDGQVDNAIYYLDADADGFGDANGSGVSVCLAIGDYVINNDDCNDGNELIYPGATEVCNSLDDNCDTQIDEGVQNNYYADSDSDGFGAGTATLACAAPTGFVTSNTDCNNNDGAVFPNAIEVCNNVDDNCDSQIDEGVQNIYYSDADGDGFGAGSETAACAAPSGFVSTNTDCNNNDALVYPGATELCNSVDDDCDTQIDEGVQISFYADLDGDGFGLGVATLACSAPNGMVASNTDCDDAVAAVNPDATESCNGIDDDCDGGIDEFGTSPVAQVVTSCGPYTWNETNATYSSSGTYYSNIPVASTFNSLASFTSASNIVGYQVSETEDFSEFGGYFTTAIGTLGAGFPTWSATGVSGFYAYQVDGSTAIAANQHSSALTFNFSSGVTGVGGNFFVTDVLGNVISNTINITLSDGTTQSLWIDSSNSFTGYISNGALINSISINTPWIVQTNPYVRVDNLVVTTGTPVYSCSTEILELVVNTPVYYYADADADGFGGEEDSLSCTQPAGFVLNNGDCDDNFALVYPVAFEVCNNIDDNCNGVADEGVQTMYFADNDGDAYGEMSAVSLACATPVGYVENGVDCNDSNPAINPIASETCNLIDDNCNGFADEGVVNVYYIDSDGDGYGDLSNSTISCSAPASFVENYSDCDDTNASANLSAAEICNGIDDNCADGIDNGLQFNNYYSDADGDNYGAGAAQSLCANPGAGYSSQLGDCNDNSSAIKPGAAEICGNGIDEDCSGADLICTPTGGISASVNIFNIGTYNTGVQTNVPINLVNGTDTPENPGTGNELWFNFTAQSNAVRIQLTGSNLVNDDNDLSLFDQPSAIGSALIPLLSENDVHPGAQGAATDGGNEVLLFDGLISGNVYYLCVRNNNNSPGLVSLRIAYLHGSQTDIGPYTNYTGIYSNNCQNFKAKFRSGSSGYTVKRFNTAASVSDGSQPDWVYAIPAGANPSVASTVCQLGRIVPPNLGNANQTYFIKVDAHYNLPDAYGNVTPITAIGNVVGSITMAPEISLTVRSTDQCPYYKVLTSSIATDRSVCGVTQYNWEFTQVIPTSGIPLSVNGAVGGSRILPMSLIPGIAMGQRYDVRIRGKHIDNSYSAFTANPACVRTMGASGAPTLENEKEPVSAMLHNAAIQLYPNPNLGESLQLSVGNFEGSLFVEVLDATGRMIQKGEYFSDGNLNSIIEFNEALPNGIYHLKVGDGNETAVLKFIVNR